MGSISREIASTARIANTLVNFHDVGSSAGDALPTLLIHGSGPGVSAWANWRTVLPRLGERGRLIAPDMLGFGYTQTSEPVQFDIDAWLGQLTGLLDHLSVPRCSIIGNSFGGALALRFARRCPQRVERLLLMGPVGTSFPLTHGLDKVWGYQPSLANMRELIGVFAHNQALKDTDLTAMRFEASRRPTVQERYAALFPAPRQRWVDALALADEDLHRIDCDVLIVHGLDDQIIPFAAAQKLRGLLPRATLVGVPECGHWVQVEQTELFCDLAENFLDGGGTGAR